MPSDDRYAPEAPTLSLSEKLRELEAELGRVDKMSLPPPGRRSKLPMSLGRPIGLTQPDGFPRILTIEQDTPANADATSPRGWAVRRAAAVAGVVLALFFITAILPPLIWRHAESPASVTDEEAAFVSSGRTNQFANVARDLALAPHAPVALPATMLLPGATAPEASPQPRLPIVESPVPPKEARQALATPAPAAVNSEAHEATTLEVAESELPRLTLPKIVSGVAPPTSGSAVVIDGLPDEARVSPGIRIARDSWAVGIRDVDYAVLSLPRDTPDRLDLVVRVVAADSQQLVANTLHIRVLRTANAAEPSNAAEVPPSARPRARFEPASGFGAPGLEAVVPLPTRKPAIVLKRAAAPSPSWPTYVSTWSQTEPSTPPPPRMEKAPPWAPFGSP